MNTLVWFKVYKINKKSRDLPLCRRTLRRKPRLSGKISALFDINCPNDVVFTIVIVVVVVVVVVVTTRVIRIRNIVVVRCIGWRIIDIVTGYIIAISSEGHCWR